MSVGAVNKQTGDRIPTAGLLAVDSVLSGSSTNPVQNRVVKAAFDAIKDGQSIDSFADVETALGEKADTDIVASDFSSATSYTAGEYCIYGGKFYKFKNNHSGAWAAADVDEIKIAGELASLKSGLTNLNTAESGEYMGTVPNGKSGSNIYMTMPIWNPLKKTITITEAYIYDSNGDWTDIKSAITLDATRKSYVNISMAYNASYVGKMIRVSYTISNS